MNMGESAQRPADGLYRIGYVANMKNGAYISELQELLNGTEQEPSSREIRERATNAEILFLNKHGYEQDAAGTAVAPNRAKFKAFNTGYTLDGQDVYGWFESDDNGGFTGVSWGTLQQLRSYAWLKAKTERLFKMGDFYFNDIDECQTFLEDLASSIMPENWAYKNKPSVIKYPILKNYIENVFLKLKKEGKVLKSSDGKSIIFNTNLMDKFFHSVYIVAEVKEAEGLEAYFNPRRTAEESYSVLRRYGFDKVSPEPPKFFSDVNEVVFDPSWPIDKNYDSLQHITEQRLDRFPAGVRSKGSLVLAKKLYEAIDYAMKMAQRNYKYIVPIYYPKFDRLSFLMPIFLDGTYNAMPDFALVLQTDAENKMYIAKTILELEAGYQDARLIAKPDESWLNPITIR